MHSDGEAWRVFEHPIYVQARASRMANLRAHFDLETLRGKRVLEAGSGTGELGEFLEQAGCRVVSVDAREEFLVRLRQKYPGRETYCIDLEHWDSKSLGRFDAILAFGILYHLAEPEAFLRACTSITDTLLLETMVRDSAWAEVQRVTDNLAEGAWSRVGCRPTLTWISRTLEDCGFRTEDISTAEANWYGPFPSIFDWEPRNEGGWTRGNTVLRRMLVCRRQPGKIRPPRREPFQLARLEPALNLELEPSDPASARIVHLLRHSGYRAVRESSSEGRVQIGFGLQAEPGVDLRPLLVHVHIPKCAGTSFQRMLQTSFGERHRDYYPEDQSRQLTGEEWLRLVVENPAAISFSSHSIRVFPPVLADRQALYVAFLREPVSRYVSHLTYFKKHYQSLPAGVKEHLPPGCGEMSLRQQAEWLFEHQPDSFHRSLLATHFLGEQTWVDTVGGMLHLSDRWLESGTLLYAGFEPVKLALATAILEDFFFVGLVEEMDTSLRLLRERLAPQGLALAALPVPQENVSRELADDLAWLTPSDPVGREVLTRLEIDIRLYRRFESRFRALCHN